MQKSDLKTIIEELETSQANTCSIGADWSQGRSAFGGISAALATTGMRKILQTPQPIRSLMVSFIGPLTPGKVAVESHVQRKGKNVTQTRADVFSDNDLCLQAMGVFGNSRKALHVPADYQFNPKPRETGIAFEEHAKRLPAFLQYFEGSWVSGALPFTGKLQRKLSLWAKHRSDMSAHPIEKIVTIADIPPPVLLSHFDKPPVNASSLSWSLEFVTPPETIQSDWFYLEFEVEAAADGYTQQAGRIFDESGQLCALSRQCMVYFG